MAFSTLFLFKTTKDVGDYYQTVRHTTFAESVAMTSVRTVDHLAYNRG